MRSTGTPITFLPQLKGLVIVLVNRHPQLVCREIDLPGKKFPGVLDGFLLEIISKGEVAEHLEEGMVPRRMADILEIVVLAAGANALLARDRAFVVPLILAEEHALELDHSRVREQERRVVLRNEGRTRHHLVALPGKIINEQIA